MDRVGPGVVRGEKGVAHGIADKCAAHGFKTVDFPQRKLFAGLEPLANGFLGFFAFRRECLEVAGETIGGIRTAFACEDHGADHFMAPVLNGRDEIVGEFNKRRVLEIVEIGLVRGRGEGDLRLGGTGAQGQDKQEKEKDADAADVDGVFLEECLDAGVTELGAKRLDGGQPFMSGGVSVSAGTGT